MSEQQLIVRKDLEISFNAAAERMRLDALVVAAGVEGVSDEESQAVAVAAQTALRECLKAVEDSRKFIKGPVIDFGRKIDSAAREFVAQVEQELTRVSGLVGDYQAIELAKVRAAEAARAKELSELERKRQEALAKANSMEERERVQEEHSQRVHCLPAPVVAPKAEGQVVKPDWDFEVTDPYTLARMHPNLVKIEPRRLEIREHLKAGLPVQGIRAWEVVKATVRLKAGKEIAVTADYTDGHGFFYGKKCKSIKCSETGG